MRTEQRLRGLRKWVEKNLCAGRIMKFPGPNMSLKEVVKGEPNCFIGWAPTRMDSTGNLKEDIFTAASSITIMPNQSYAKYMEEKRFDRYNNVHRPSDLGSHLAITMLFSVYEPGIRLPGFIDSMDERGKGLDMSLIKEATEEGVFTLFNWMDDCKEALLRDKSIEGTDLFVDEETITYSFYTDQNYVVDRRPMYYGFVNVNFGGYADEGVNPINKDLLI